MENHYLDELAKKALQNMDVPYEPDDWELMASRLEQERQMRRRLMISKAIECTLLVFAIWTVHKVLPSEYFPSSQNQPGTHQLYQDIPVDSETETAPFDLEAFESMPRASVEPNIPVPTNAPDLLLPAPKPVAFASESPKTQAYTTNSTLEFSNQTLITPDHSTYINQAPSAVQSKAMNLEAQAIADISGIRQVVLHHDPVPQKRKKRKTLSIGISSDMNAIADNLDMGFTIGSSIGFEMNEFWTLETGFAFARKTFDYIAVNRQGFPINEKEIQKVQMGVFEIPLIAQVNFKHTTKWRSYASLGVRAHLVAFSDFNGSKLELSHEIPMSGSRGAFEGGDFASNFYASANIGFGLERRLTKTFSLFIQPTYQLSLNSVGPYEDKMSTLSLVMGARTNL